MTTNVSAAGAAPLAGSRRIAWLLNYIQSRLQDSAIGFEITTHDGTTHRFGAGPASFRVNITHPSGLKAISSLDEANIAQAYVEGWFDVEGDFIKIFDLREQLHDRHPLHWLWRFLAPLLMGQVAVNKSTIVRHYERDAEFFLAFLDESFHCYTQGVFLSPDEDLEVAFRRKMDCVVDECRLAPGSQVLEVGPGWGAFAAYAARKGIEITGVTISRQSLDFMNRLTAEENLPITTLLCDFLEFESEKQFDSIVVLGIMEHMPDYPRVLARLDRLLKPGGRVFIDAGACSRKYEMSSFITRQIYPGNNSFLVLHDFLKSMASFPFDLKGVWDDRISYYWTCVGWAKRLDSNKESIIEKFGEAEYRRFRLYLWGSAHCFLRNRLQCYRLVLEKHAS